MKYITITEPAVVYLNELLEKQNSPGMGVRVFVEKPGTPYAECCMAYAAAGEEKADDVYQECEGFRAWIDAASIIFLEDAVIDYAKDRLGGQLTFRAPKAKIPRVGENATVEERIYHLLQAEVNPSLAGHGGSVTLVELVDDGTTAVLQFGGGCQGCSAVDTTLKQGVEKTLLENIPELKSVIDTTDHSQRENAYYQ